MRKKLFQALQRKWYYPVFQSYAIQTLLAARASETDDVVVADIEYTPYNAAKDEYDEVSLHNQ